LKKAKEAERETEPAIEEVKEEEGNEEKKKHPFVDLRGTVTNGTDRSNGDRTRTVHIDPGNKLDLKMVALPWRDG
jgi:hypothetical protein